MRNFFRCVFAVILSLIFLCVNSCSDDDFGDQSNSDKGSVDLELADKAWVSTNFDINVNEAEDYADVSIESVVLYFVDSNRGIWLFNLIGRRNHRHYMNLHIGKLRKELLQIRI